MGCLGRQKSGKESNLSKESDIQIIPNCKLIVKWKYDCNSAHGVPLTTTPSKSSSPQICSIFAKLISSKFKHKLLRRLLLNSRNGLLASSVLDSVQRNMRDPWPSWSAPRPSVPLWYFEGPRLLPTHRCGPGKQNIRKAPGTHDSQHLLKRQSLKKSCTPVGLAYYPASRRDFLVSLESSGEVHWTAIAPCAFNRRVSSESVSRRRPPDSATMHRHQSTLFEEPIFDVDRICYNSC